MRSGAITVEDSCQSDVSCWFKGRNVHLREMDDDILYALRDKNFNSDRFLSEILFNRNMDLDELIKLEGQITQQLMHLGGDVQATVYESYSRLIRTAIILSRISSSMKSEFGHGIEKLKSICNNNESSLNAIECLQQVGHGDREQTMSSALNPTGMAAMIKRLRALNDATDTNRLSNHLLVLIDQLKVHSIRTLCFALDTVFRNYKESRAFASRFTLWMSQKGHLIDYVKSKNYDAIDALRLRSALGEDPALIIRDCAMVLERDLNGFIVDENGFIAEVCRILIDYESTMERILDGEMDTFQKSLWDDLVDDLLRKLLCGIPNSKTVFSAINSLKLDKNCEEVDFVVILNMQS
ncbi:hypothetical protein ACOME3_009672 [Neoechinorhynchus agilis]